MKQDNGESQITMNPSNWQIIENIPNHGALVAASLVFKQCW